MSLKIQVVKSLGWNTIAVIVNTLAQILRIAVLARLLDTSDFGLVAISLAVVAFCEIFSDLGFTVPLLHKQDINSNEYSSVFWMNVLLSAGIYCVLFLISPIIANCYQSSDLIPIIRMLGITVIINAMGKIFQTIKTKELQFAFISIVSIISCIIGFISIVVLALRGWGVYSLVVGTIIQIASRQGVYFCFGLRSSIIKFHLDFYEIRDFFRIGSYQIGAQVCDFVVSKIDVFILGKLVGMSDLGYYNLAKELILKCYGLMNSVSRGVMTAALAKLQREPNRMDKVFSVYSELLSFVGLLLFMFIYVFSTPISQMMYGTNSINVLSLLKILCVYGIFSTFISPMSSLTIAKGRTDITFAWTLISALICIVLTTIGATIGLYGLVYAQVIISIVFFFLNWQLIIKPLTKICLSSYLCMYKSSIFVMTIVIITIELLNVKAIIGMVLCYLTLVLSVVFICYKNKDRYLLLKKE